jgi:hypothetical protein
VAVLDDRAALTGEPLWRAERRESDQGPGGCESSIICHQQSGPGGARAVLGAVLVTTPTLRRPGDGARALGRQLVVSSEERAEHGY